MSMLASTTSLEIPIGRRTSNNSSNERLTLMGRSRAGDGTAFCIPQLKWLLDCGVPVQKWTPRHVFLSHTHSDHVHYLTHINSPKSQGGGNKAKPPLIFLPAKALPFVECYLRAHQEMTDCMSMMESSQNDSNGDDGGVAQTCIKDFLKLRPTLPGEEIALSGVGGGRQYYVRTVECHHRIDTLGFSVFRKGKKRLKQEYVGLPGREIGRLRKEGNVDLYMPTIEDEAVFCFLGDTTHQVFESHPEILTQHSTVIVECSFIDEEDVARAAKTKHMHWNHLRPHVEAHPETFFVLIHFSLKYSSLELRRFFCKVSSQHQNIHPMLLEQEVQADWNKSGFKGDQRQEAAPPTCNCRICTSSGSTSSKTTED